jgi:hypothetical protein
MRLKAWGMAAQEAHDASGLYVDSSELIENGSFYGSSRQIFMTNNRFRMTGYGESVVALWGGVIFRWSATTLPMPMKAAMTGMALVDSLSGKRIPAA